MDTGTQHYRDAFDSYLRGKLPLHEMARRGLTVDVNASGGYLALPTELADIVKQTVDQLAGVYSLSTRFKIVNGAGFGVPKVSARGDDADFSTEVDTVNADVSLTLDRKDLTGQNQLTKLVKASMMLANRLPKFGNFVARQMGRLFAVSIEKALLTGSGTGEPRGLFTAHADGIPTTRDVSMGNTATEVTLEGLNAAKNSIKPAYLRRPGARWVCHDDFRSLVDGLQDKTGAPIFVAGRYGYDDMLLGVRVAYSEFAPNTYTTGQYAAVLGDLGEYHVAESECDLQVLDQLYSLTNDLGYIGRQAIDGNAFNAEAFARVKLG